MKGMIEVLKQVENITRADYDILADSFAEDLDLLDISNFPLVSIYFNPKDYAGKFVARLFDIQAGDVCSTRYIMIRDSLEDIRKEMPAGLYRLDRTQDDDLELLEVWV